jgi:hypothetical protein
MSQQFGERAKRGEGVKNSLKMDNIFHGWFPPPPHNFLTLDQIGLKICNFYQISHRALNPNSFMYFGDFWC